MADVVLRNLDDALKSKLRLRAASNRRSMNAELREILSAALRDDQTADRRRQARPVLHRPRSDISRGRASSGATLIAPPTLDGRTTIQDSGIPDQFLYTDEKLYVRIVGAADPEDVGRMLRVLHSVAPAVESPLGSGLYPHQIVVDDAAVAYALTAMKQDDGGVFADFTPEAASDAPDDVQLLPVSPALNDAAYFGASKRFGFLTISVTTPGTGIWTIAWEYWNGAVWSGFPAVSGLIDGTQGFTVAGNAVVTVSALPADWASVAVDGVVAFYWRARIWASFSMIGPSTATLLALR